MTAGSLRFFGVVAFLVIAAGCADDVVTPSGFMDDQGDVLDGPLVSDSTGAVVGFVLDESLAPVGNATVRLSNTSKESAALQEVVTDASGTFTFGALSPMTYRISAEATGFATASQLVQVLAGEMTRATLTMGSVASKEAYVELFIDVGVTGCSFTAVWLVLGGPCGLLLPDTYKSTFPKTIPDTWAYLVFESQWQTSEAIWMFIDLDDDGTCLNPGAPCPGSIINTSPLRVDGAPESGLGTIQYQHGDITYPPGGKEFPLWVNFSDFGLLYNEINTYGKPVCDLNGYCGGVGTALEIRFNLYTSVFHNEPPPSPEHYSAVPDS